jgi:uncharacterized alkaline shock family protein YloU
MTNRNKNGGSEMTQDRISEQEMIPRLAELARLETIEVGGETAIDDEVIGAVAGVAAREIEGVASLGTSSIRRSIAERVGSREQKARGVGVEAGRREAILDIDVRVIYGFSIPETVVKVRQNVAHRVLELCGLVSKEININVVGIEFPDRMPGRVD